MKTLLNISQEFDNPIKKKDFYNCNFCPQNMELYEIEKHFKTFHKFRCSDDEYYCEFCDSDEAFQTKDELLEHIHSIQHIAAKAIPEPRMESFDVGKLKFLNLMANFKSQKDAINLLFWIKCNDTETFLEHQEIETNEFLNRLQDENADPIFDGDCTDSNSLNDNFEKTTSTDAIFTQQKIFQNDINEESNAEILDEDTSDSDLTQNIEPENFKEEFFSKDSNDEIVNKESDLDSLLDYVMASDNENEEFQSSINSNKLQDSFDENTEQILDRESVNPDARFDLKNAPPNEVIFEDDINEQTREKLKTHKHTVHGCHKDYKCDYCGKSFTNARNLIRHKHTVHEGHKDYKCESCGKSFTQAVGLNTHKHTVHEGRKDYQCDSCGKSFSQVQHLKGHTHAVHERKKDFNCKSCGKPFSQKSNLKKHIQIIHEGHKDYKSESSSKSLSEDGESTEAF